MEKEEALIESLYKQLINASCEFYKDEFINGSERKIIDPYWKEALKMFANLSAEDKVTLFKIIKQIQVDSISEILGILDGIVCVDNEFMEFKVIIDKDDEPINGSLQELFLSYDEEQRKRE
ncbi:transposase [Baia soyae]|uniref:transposase n=1 Tax=Baia soyae TaxID=1544746 RepID=UPI0010502ACE|nr:transposase [Baia soyae]